MKGRPPSSAVDTAFDEIMADMLEARWRAGRSHKAYAERYGVAVATVEGWAAQVSRLKIFIVAIPVLLHFGAIALSWPRMVDFRSTTPLNALGTRYWTDRAQRKGASVAGDPSLVTPR